MCDTMNAGMIESADLSTELGRNMLADYLADCGIECATSDLRAFLFFWHNAGWSYAPGESPECGRARRAVELVAAEKWGHEQDITWVWQYDELGIWDDYEGEDDPSTENCLASHPDGRHASLSGIDGPYSNYRRVVQAQLAAEIRSQGEVSAYVFTSPITRAEIVVERNTSDYSTFRERYPNGTRATGIDVVDNNDDDARYWLVCVADCFDPPLTIVSAGSEQDALDAFIDETTWAHITPDDLADYHEDSISYGPRGQPYDGESIVIRPARKVRVVR